ADADVINMRGEDDIFVFQRGVGAGELGEEVGGLNGCGEDDGVGFKRSGEREMRERLAVFAKSGNFGEGVTRTREEGLRGSRIEGNAELQAGSLLKLGAGESHGGMIAIHG